MEKHPFLTHLSSEHATIQAVLSLLQSHLNALSRERPKDWREDCLILIEALKFFLHDLHHKKEEEILFPYLQKSKRLNEGGPKCGYYFPLFLEFNPQRIVKVPILEKSFLSVPLTEHQAGHITLSEIERSVKQEDLSTFKVMHFGETYLKFMRLHIEKEENCLFKIADQILLDNPDDGELIEKALIEDKRQAGEIKKVKDTFWKIAMKLSYDGDHSQHLRNQAKSK
jgi:hemerythrin-like domain-containing protein